MEKPGVCHNCGLNAGLCLCARQEHDEYFRPNRYKCDVCGYTSKAMHLRCPMDNTVLIYKEDYPVERKQQAAHRLFNEAQQRFTPTRETTNKGLIAELVALRDGDRVTEDETYSINSVIKTLQRIDALCPTCGK